MKIEDLRGSWALVTGASSGIGMEFARQLASHHINLCLVARRQNILETLAADLSIKYGIRVLALKADLSVVGAVSKLKNDLVNQKIKIRLLCNNAAFAHWGEFEKASDDVYQEMLLLNTGAIVSLCHAFLPDLLSLSPSVIINVSSQAAFQAVPYMAVYAATKAFVHNFSQALYGEYKNQGLLVQTLIPGPTKTQWLDHVKDIDKTTLPASGSPTKVVQISLAAIASGEPVVTSTQGVFQQRLLAALVPSRILISKAGQMFKPSRSIVKTNKNPI